RSEVSEFQARVEEIRARQNALKDRLGEAVTKRRSIEQLFVEYQATQQDIDLEAQLGASIGALERDGDISLAERIKRITESRQELSQRVSNLAEELSKLDNSHRDINSLFARLS